MNRPPEILRVGGIVLCGGESRRMGTSKAWLPWGSGTLLQHIAGRLAESASPVVLATRRGVDLPPLSGEFRVVYDQDEHGGPLAGIAAGMIALNGECDAVLVTACDQPFVNALLFRRMIDRLGERNAVVAEREGKLFPTLALYRRSTLKIVEGLLNNGQFRAQDFARHCDPVRLRAADLADFDPDLRSFCNINESAEHEAALRSINSHSVKGLPCEH